MDQAFLVLFIQQWKTKVKFLTEGKKVQLVARNIGCLILILIWSQLSLALPRILIVSPEQTGIYQTGGLAHATSDLASSLIQTGYQVEVMMPYYSDMKAENPHSTGETFSVPLYRVPGFSHKSSEFSAHRYQNGTNPTIFLRHDNKAGEENLFDNRLNPMIGRNYTYAPEPIEAFGVLSKAQAEYILSKDYDIVILNDWTSGMLALQLHLAKLANRKVPKVIFAIHNIAYQGVFPRTLTTTLGLDPQLFNRQIAQFYGQSFLKTGIQYADMVYTVSPQYSREITTRRFGSGLDSLMRFKAKDNRLTGILNGIINSHWDPTQIAEGLPTTFSASDFSGKALGKASLQKSLGLPVESETPLFVLTSRLAEQKGFVYLLGAIERMAMTSQKAQWVVIGDGEKEFVTRLSELQSRFPDKIHYSNFSNLLEKQLMRYGDFFVNGAWFEPSGLNQFFALKNGTIPVVSQTGGLLDSVRDGVTGLTFPIVYQAANKGYDIQQTELSVYQAFVRAVQLYPTQAFRKMRVQAMSQDNSWSHRIRESYGPLFDYVLEEKFDKGSFKAKTTTAPGPVPSSKDPLTAVRGTARPKVIRSCSQIHRDGGL